LEANLEKTVRTVCQACHCECGILVTVRDGRVVGVKGDPDHPMNRGFICPKGKAEPERLYHPDRLKFPLRRAGERGEGNWTRISWDEALDEIGRALTRVKERYGPESIAAIHGTGPRASLCSSLLPFALGSPNRISIDLHICFAPSLIAEGSTVGHSVMMEQGPDYREAKCIVVWGGNPLASHPARGHDILEAKKMKKAKLIVIDPRETSLASEADLWLQVRPGTDDALALGMMNVIIENGLYDKAFVENWCVGFDRLKERVRAFTLERVSEITWVSAEKIAAAAEMYGLTKPAALHHRVAIEHNINSAQTDRALVILIALTGNLDIRGGNLLPMPMDGYIPSIAIAGAGPWLRPDEEVIEKRIGAKEFPLIAGTEAPLPFVPSPLAVEAMEEGRPYPLKALYAAGSNALVNVQNSKRVLNALRNLDLHVAVDFFMTPTAEFADYVLPATTWLERDEICDLSYMGAITARQKAVEPLYESWDDLKIVIELVKRIPWAERKIVPWNSPVECYDWMLQGMGMTFQELKEKGCITVPHEYKKYEREGFHTPSGKVELSSSVFEKYGYDPLPDYKEPPEGPLSTPGLMETYPLILITGGRSIAYFHSEGRQIPSLRKLAPDPEIEIHPDTAVGLGISGGDWVWIETPQVAGERVKLRAKVTSRVHPRMVHAAHGWWFPERPGPEHGCFDCNINVVMSGDPPRDEICASVPTRGTLCRIYKQQG
jgi:thiosulfate reductase/polysulfide reductase chain A